MSLWNSLWGLVPDALAETSHPRLVAVGLLGLVFLVVAALLSSTAPTLAFRLGFVGAVVLLFGVSGYIAFTVSEYGDRRRGV